MLFYEASAKIQSCRIVEKYLKNSNGERSIHDQDERIWCDLEDCAIEYSGEHEYKIVVFVCYIDTNISNVRVEFRVISNNYKENAMEHIYGYIEKCGIKIYDFIITVNGRKDTVTLSYEEYKKMKAHIELLELLAEAEDDVKNKRMAPISETFDDLLNMLQG